MVVINNTRRKWENMRKELNQAVVFFSFLASPLPESVLLNPLHVEVSTRAPCPQVSKEL